MAYIGKQPVVGNFVKLDAIVTSATATYNLLNGGVAYSPQSPNHCIVSLNGVIQSPTTSFTISGSTIVFASALTATDVIDFILVLGDVLNIGTPSDGTVTFPKVTSNLITGATAETSIAGGDSILIYDDSATALRKMTRTNFVSGLGITEADAWRVNTVTNFTGLGSSDVTANWERADSDGFGLLGTGLTQSSGIFTFPSTGYWYINHFAAFSTSAARLYMGFHLFTTLNNSSYTSATEIYDNTHSSSTYASTAGSFIIKVTDIANIKFKFQVERNDTVTLNGSTSTSNTGFSCIKLGEI